MGKKAQSDPQAEHERQMREGGNMDTAKVATIHEHTILNGHKLPAGTVVEMTPEDIAKHRQGGVPLDDVEDDDKREVYDISEPFESPDTEGQKDGE